MRRFGNWDWGLTFMVGKDFGRECVSPFDFSVQELGGSNYMGWAVAKGVFSINWFFTQ